MHSWYFAALSYLWVMCSVLIIVIGVMFYRLYRTKRVINKLASMRHIQDLVLINFSSARLIVKAGLFVLGFLMLSLALLRPQSQGESRTVAQEGRDLFIALDISKSMLAQDCAPNRLACARAKIKALLQQLSCERVGLILFSGSAFVQCPLTKDYGAFTLFLDQVDVETISSGSTVLDQAVSTAAAQFSQLPDRKNKLLVILTDGEDFSSDMSALQDKIRQSGMHVFALGVGTAQGAPIPLYDVRGAAIGHQKDVHGAVVITKLDENLLRSLTHDLGGMYVPMSTDDKDIRAIAGRVHKYEKEKFDDAMTSYAYEWYPILVGLSAVFFLIEWIL